MADNHACSEDEGHFALVSERTIVPVPLTNSHARPTPISLGSLHINRVNTKILHILQVPISLVSRRQSTLDEQVRIRMGLRGDDVPMLGLSLDFNLENRVVATAREGKKPDPYNSLDVWSSRWMRRCCLPAKSARSTPKRGSALLQARSMTSLSTAANKDLST